MDDFQRTFLDFELMRSQLETLLTVGLPNTLKLTLTLAAFLFATLMGLVLCLALISPYRILRFVARVWVDVWRGLPAILSILLIGGGLPLAGLDVFGRSTYVYAIAALAIINGAFLAEVFRSGVQSVDIGQSEAARSLGVSRWKTTVLVLLPQGLRRVLPASTNQAIITLKESALVYILGLVASQRELFSIGSDTAARTGNYSVMVASAAFFLAITIPMTYLVNVWDRRLREGRRAGRRRGSGPKPVGDFMGAST